MLADHIKIIDNLVSNISYEHERDSWQRIKAELAESTNSSHNTGSPKLADLLCGALDLCQAGDFDIGYKVIYEVIGQLRASA
jgi:hypothetical protein